MTKKDFRNAVISKLGLLSVHQGTKNQNDVFWTRITLNDVIKGALKQEYQDKGYYAINLTPYYVDQRCWKEIKSHKHFGTEYELPNIDKTSGNLHPKWTDEDNENWLKDPVFRQAVLVAKKGPKCGKIKYDEDDITKALDYCSCYYPPVDGSEEFGKCSTEGLIKGLLKRVLDPESKVYTSVFGADCEE